MYSRISMRLPLALPATGLLFAFVLLMILSPAGATMNSLQPTGKLLPEDGGEYFHFGYSLAVDGDTAVIGAPRWNDYQGTAYVFTRGDYDWSQQARLLREEGMIREGFGSAVSVDDDTLVIGVFGMNRPSPNFAVDAGAVMVYTGSGATWTEQAFLMPDDLADSNFFGHDLDLDGDTLIVGAPGISRNESAYIFRRQGANWTLEAKLPAPEGATAFGSAVAVSGDMALVVAQGATAGVVYAFTRSGATWSPAGSLPPMGQDEDRFVCALDFEAQTAVVAACGPSSSYVFDYNGTTWAQTAVLDPEIDDPYAVLSAVAVRGNRVILGAPNLSIGSEYSVGAAFTYERTDGVWEPADTLYAPDALEEDRFGAAVALTDEGAMVGAPDKALLLNPQQGAVYVYESPLPAADRVLIPIVGAGFGYSPIDEPIVYVDQTGSKTNLFIINPEGTGKRNLTHSEFQETGPRWSPNRAQIAFLTRAPSGAYELTVMNADGSGRRIVPTGDLDFLVGPPEWSPDGTRIAFSAYEDDYDIYAVNLDGSGLTNLTSSVSGGATWPAWSPDGDHIVFSIEAEQSDLMILTVATGAAAKLTDDEALEQAAAWSPDGTTILFTSESESGRGLRVMPAAGGSSQMLINNGLFGRWSADGARIVFVGRGANGRTGGIFRANADGSGVTVVDPSLDAMYPDW